jgi:hypothetical protein
MSAAFLVIEPAAPQRWRVKIDCSPPKRFRFRS